MPNQSTVVMPDESPMTLAGYMPTREEYDRVLRLLRALTAQLAAKDAELREWQSGRRVWVSPAELDAMIERHDPSLEDPDAARL